MLSVIVCTRNRSSILSKCLESLAKQSLAKRDYEVIVVDNDSTDDTDLVVDSYLNKEKNFRVCGEIRLGANHARNAGANIAVGSYLVFIDDDAVANSDWLHEIISFISRHPDVKLFGGPYEAYSLVSKPSWFPPEFGSLDLGYEERPISFGAEWLTCTNLVVRKDIFFEIGGFHEKLGSVVDGIFYYGEETRLIIDAFKHGCSVYYVPAMRVKHLIRSDKFNLRYLLKTYYRKGKQHHDIFETEIQLHNQLVTLILLFCKSLGALVSFNSVPIKRKIYYSLYPLCYQIGVTIDYMYRRLY